MSEWLPEWVLLIVSLLGIAFGTRTIALARRDLKRLERDNVNGGAIIAGRAYIATTTLATTQFVIVFFLSIWLIARPASSTDRSVLIWVTVALLGLGITRLSVFNRARIDADQAERASRLGR